MYSTSGTIEIPSGISVESVSSVEIIPVISEAISYRAVPSSVREVPYNTIIPERTDIEYVPWSPDIGGIPRANKPRVIIEISERVIEYSLPSNTNNSSVIIPNFNASRLDDSSKFVVEYRYVLHLDNSTIVVVLNIGIIIVSGIE